MRGYMRILNPDGSGSTREYSAPPPLDDLKDAVGGWIELVPYFQCVVEGRGQERIDDCVVYCNEEGKIKGMQPNLYADQMWHDAQLRKYGVVIPDHLVGTIAIIWGDKTFMLAL